MKKIALFFVAMAMVTLVTSPTWATLLTLSVSPDTTPTQSALNMQATDVMSPFSADIDAAGGEADFTAFFLRTDEAWVNGDDLVASAWTVGLSGTFGTENFSGEINVSTVGTIESWGLTQGWNLLSEENTSFQLSEGILSFNLAPTSVSYGMFQGPNGSGNDGAWITGTASFTANGGGGNAPVPEPATMVLFGTGLAGLVGFGHTRKKKV